MLPLYCVIQPKQQTQDLTYNIKMISITPFTRKVEQIHLTKTYGSCPSKLDVGQTPYSHSNKIYP